MLVTNDQGNFLMLQKAKKPGEKSTKVGTFIHPQLLVDLPFAVDPCNGGQGRDDLHNGGGRPARDCLCSEVQESCIERFMEI